jgi:hypothetical protein
MCMTSDTFMMIVHVGKAYIFMLGVKINSCNTPSKLG